MASVSENINKINQLISENIDDLVFIINDKFNCEYNNFEALTTKKYLNDYIHPKDSKRVTEFVKNIFQFGSGIEEARITNHNKIFSWYEVKGTKFVDNENIDKVFLLCRNISKLKTKEKEIKNYQKSYDQLAETLPEINYWKLLQSNESKTAIQRTREMLELVINNIPQFIYWKDKKLNYIGCNTRFAQSNGFNRASLIIGESTEDLRWGREKTDYIKEAERSVMENMEAEYNIIELLTTPNGIQTWFEINRIPLHDLEGNVEGILVTYEDITRRINSERKLKESEENYRTIFNASPDYIYVTDINGRMHDANPGLLDRIGITLEEFKRTNFIQYFAGDDLEGLMEIFKDLTLGKEIKGLEIRAKNIHGEIFEYEVNAVPLKKDGKVNKILNLARDITDKKIAEQKLKASEKKYRHLFESAPYAIWLIDADGTILDCNTPMTKLLSVSKIEDLIGKNFSEVLSVLKRSDYLIDVLKERFNKFQTNEDQGPLEIQITRVDGKRLWLSIHNTLVNVGDKILTQAIIRDITARKTAEQKLRESEIKYRHLFENTPYSIILVDRKGEIIDCNPATEELFQRSMKELLNKSFLDISMKPENLLPLFKERYDSILEGVIPKTLEVQITRSSDNKRIWISIDDTLVEIGGETVFQVIIQDITEKKIAEKRLQSSQEELKALNRELELKIKERTKDLIESERQYRTTINSLGDPLHVVNRDLNIILANQAIIKWLTELEVDSEIVGKNLFSVFPFLPPMIEEEYKQVFESGNPLLTTESTILPAFNAVTETRKIPIFSGGEVEQVITIIRDITESREMEIQLKESEEKYRRMVNDLDIAFYRGEHKGGLLMYNQSLARMLDLDPDQNIIGKGTGDFFIDLKMQEKYYKELEEKGYIRNFIAQIRKANGSIMTVDLNAHLIYDLEGIPIEVEGTFADITEKFRLQQELLNSEQKLREQNIELMKLDQVKNDFITMAAHELKTPLISISGYTDYILMRHRNRLPPEITVDLVTVQRNVKRLEVLMDQLLDVMKIDEQKLMLQKEVVNVKDIINECLDELSYLINEKNLEIALDIDHEIMLNIDPERIFTVFTNLISNAVKFSPDYKLIEITAKKTDSKYTFKIKDNGIGLSDEELGRLFKKFERIKRPRESENINIKDSGTGLGLYISKGIIEIHDGEIWAESEGEDKGATFTFTLPI